MANQRDKDLELVGCYIDKSDKKLLIKQARALGFEDLTQYLRHLINEALDNAGKSH